MEPLKNSPNNQFMIIGENNENGNLDELPPELLLHIFSFANNVSLRKLWSL